MLQENYLQVNDHSDPSGIGMFSHLGRFSTQKHPIFRKKQEILSKKNRYFKPSPIPFNVASM